MQVLLAVKASCVRTVRIGEFSAILLEVSVGQFTEVVDSIHGYILVSIA